MFPIKMVFPVYLMGFREICGQIIILGSIFPNPTKHDFFYFFTQNLCDSSDCITILEEFPYKLFSEI